ncbi:ATP-binding cassette domain-containing protein [Limibacter armeniacum]|uniref:ABC transporter ATP-binding protein n=1 Tax=Limibacter armeniacum TaxID=466084 RepID=UPI002FE60AEC
MKIKAEGLGKKFVRDWIFRNVDLELEIGRKYAITGGNGSGKTTLLKTLAGVMPQTEGTLLYEAEGRQVSADHIYSHLTIAGPYTEVIEEFTLTELLDFYQNFKPLSKSTGEIIDLLGYQRSKDKMIRDFSSGMKQKLKLALTFYSQGEIIMLDEPTSNLDHQNIEWYLAIATQPMPDKLVLICSNQPYEYEFCNEIISVNNYKR